MGKPPFPGGKGELPILRGALSCTLNRPQLLSMVARTWYRTPVMNDMTAPTHALALTAPQTPLRRVALLVDGENLSAGQGGFPSI